MNSYHMTLEQVGRYRLHLEEEERSAATIERYSRSLTRLCFYVRGRPVTRALLLEWKASLAGEGYAPSSVNVMLAAANGFFRHMGWEGLQMRFLKLQRAVFCDRSRELKREEYRRLVETAYGQGRRRLALALETLCGLGLRVSELRSITVEAVRWGRAEITMKGKTRTVILPGRLGRKLLRYARKKNIASGEIFITRSGKSLSRGQIWREMKRLSAPAHTAASKVYPHNLRHLFARQYYQMYQDVVKLADILGHSSIQTTRIYLISTGEEHARQIEQLGLVT